MFFKKKPPQPAISPEDEFRVELDELIDKHLKTLPAETVFDALHWAIDHYGLSGK